MTEALSSSGGKKAHMRRGLKRVILHIILLGILGLFCLILGLIGKGKLTSLTESRRAPKYADTLYTETEALVKDAALSLIPETDTAAKRTVNNALSGKRSSLKKEVNRSLVPNAEENGEPSTLIPAEQVVCTVYDTLANAIQSKTEGSDYSAPLKEVLEKERTGITQEALSRAEASVLSVTTDSVKAEMSVTATPHYALMYYSAALSIVGVVCLLLCALLTVLWFTGNEDKRARLGELIEPFDYLLPFLVGVGVFTLYPMVRVLIMSFQEKYSLGKNGTGTFVRWGLGNYEFVLSGTGSAQFLRSLKNTALYVAFTVPITAVIAIVAAWLLNQKSKLSSLFQTAYFLPMVTTATAVGLVWRWMFNRDFGLINALIGFVSQFFGAPQNINWLQTGLTDPVIPMTVLIIYGVWSSLPFTIILLLSGLQNIDENLYTVAKVDGSGTARIFFRITVPLLSPTIGLVLIINSISAFKVYTDVYVLWNGLPEHYGMETVAWYIYNNITASADGTHSMGFAAAAAMILFVIIFLFTMLQKFIQRKWVYQ